MRVLYLAEWDAFTASGVLRKIGFQYSAWRRLGVDARLILISPETTVGPPAISGKGINIHSYSTGGFAWRKISKARILRRLVDDIRDFDPEVIYYRQSSWTPWIISCLSVAQCVVTEINSNDVFEAKRQKFLKREFHLLTREQILAASHGFVCVGRELGDYYSRYGKPVEAIGNGFDTSKVKPRPPPHNDRPQLVFVGSPGQPWHGVDKLVSVSSHFSDMDFHIVGACLPRCPTNFTMHGTLGWSKLEDLYRRMDVGIATLALHRIEQEEISPLKTREYLAFGLPVIGAYEDPDVEGADCFLRIPNCEDGVSKSINQIREFIYRWKDQTIDMGYVTSRIDSELKERRRLDFMRRCLEART